MINVWHIAVIDFGCVSSRTLWVTFTFSMVKVCVVVVSCHAEKDVVERDRFWNDLDRIDHRVDK